MAVKGAQASLSGRFVLRLNTLVCVKHWVHILAEGVLDFCPGVLSSDSAEKREADKGQNRVRAVGAAGKPAFAKWLREIRGGDI